MRQYKCSINAASRSMLIFRKEISMIIQWDTLQRRDKSEAFSEDQCRFCGVVPQSGFTDPAVKETIKNKEFLESYRISVSQNDRIEKNNING